jgi:hypothetical protein
LSESTNPVVEPSVIGAREYAPIVVGHPIHTVTELQQQIHDDLRRQHPEWIEPNGESPMCDFYEARLIQLLETYTRTGSDELIAADHRTLQEAAVTNV